MHDSTMEEHKPAELIQKRYRLDAQTVAAFAAIYIVWGSTYLAIRIAVESLPALFSAGLRFAIAGAALYAWCRWRGTPAPAKREWLNLWILGALLFLAAYSGLFWAEKILPSGIASVLVATIPVWTALLEFVILRTQRFHWRMAVSVVVGLGGVLIIAVSQDALSKNLNLLACLALLEAQISWSFGSVISKHIALPESKAISAAGQMMCGGALILLCALFAGQMTPPPHVSMKAALAIAYLIVAGSIAAFTAYTWLLSRMSATTVASYAYVNPVVALAIGYWFGGEAIHTITVIGSGLVLASVVLVLSGGRHEVKH